MERYLAAAPCRQLQWWHDDPLSIVWKRGTKPWRVEARCGSIACRDVAESRELAANASDVDREGMMTDIGVQYQSQCLNCTPIPANA